MKKKLTVTVDAEVLSIARQHARSRNVSLSWLVEQRLRDIAWEEMPSFASRWRGRLKATGGANPRYDTLSKKYL